MIPMLPDVFAPHKVIYPCLVQPYIKGPRTLYQNGVFYGASPPETLGIILRDIFPPKVMLDGVFTNAFHVFDVVSYKVPFKDRFDTVYQVLNDTTKYQHGVIPVITRKVFDEEQAEDQFTFWKSEGHPGMIYRLGNCSYTKPSPKNKFNRCKQLLLRICENSTPTPTNTKATE